MMRILFFAGLAFLGYLLVKRLLTSRQSMTRGDAAKLLEVGLDADAEGIIAAHRRLIAKVHPDAGGSAELAARVNQARDILLKNLPR